MAAQNPSWSREASTLRTIYADNFKHSLKEISEGIARHEPSEKVLERHVKEAFALLAIAGNHRRPWYQRHEAEIGIGGALIGLSPSIPDVITAFLATDNEWRRALICALMVTAVILGAFLVLHGWLRIRPAVLWTLSGGSRILTKSEHAAVQSSTPEPPPPTPPIHN